MAFLVRTANFQKKLENGSLFPIILGPPSEWQVEDFISAATCHKDWIDSSLAKSGAILFQGFPVPSAQDFGRLVEAFGWEDYDYKAGGGKAVRSKVCDRVHTANENVPMNKAIGLHSEACYLKEYPSRLFFYCDIAPEAGTGGETTIAHGHVIYRRLIEERKAFADELLSTGLKFGEYSTAAFTKNRIGCTSWFNQFGTYVVNLRHVADICFGNGEVIPSEDENACAKIMEEETIKVPWQKGDIVLLDNTAALHGREPCFSDRRILASLVK